MFSYKPLDYTVDSLRILILLPCEAAETGRGKEMLKDSDSDWTDEICCNLEHRTFSSKPTYEALSYTWGEEPPCKEIKINGQPFLARENLYNALYNIRLSTKPRTVWVDAVCINQADVHERNYQVSLMTFIYTRAQGVLVWLGLPPDPLPRDPSAEKEWSGRLSIANCQAVAHHPYWTRLWIIQEVVLAHDVQFQLGARQFTWNQVSEMMTGDARPKFMQRAHRIMKQRDVQPTDEHRLEILIETFQEAQCTEKRDKIFGFLGMAHDYADNVIKVDYEIGYFDLYARAIEFHQTTMPLNKVELGREVDRAARLMKFSELVQKILGGLVEGDSKRRTQSTKPKRIYVAKGALACEILYLGPTYTETVSSLDANKKWKKAIEEYYQSDVGLMRLRMDDRAYSRVILDWDQKRLEKIRNIDTETSYGYQFEADDELLHVGKNPGYIPEVSEPRRFLGTRTLIGFVPPEARVNDLVCRFWGCDVAVVVRKVGDKLSDRWMIVGRADISTEKRSEQWHERRVELDAINFDVERYKDSIRFDLEKYKDGGGLSVTPPKKLEDTINLRLDIETLQKLTY